jgi:hypothetical protein
LAGMQQRLHAAEQDLFRPFYGVTEPSTPFLIRSENSALFSPDPPDSQTNKQRTRHHVEHSAEGQP